MDELIKESCEQIYWLELNDVKEADLVAEYVITNFEDLDGKEIFVMEDIPNEKYYVCRKKLNVGALTKEKVIGDLAWSGIKQLLTKRRERISQKEES